MTTTAFDNNATGSVADEFEETLTPGFYPQDNGTVLVILHDELKYRKAPTRKITIERELSAAEQDKAGGLAAMSMMLNQGFAKVVANVTEPQVTGNQFMNMRGKDRMNIMHGMMHFLD